MRDNLYYTTTFEGEDFPSISRTNYMGYKFEQVINEGGHRSFRLAMAQHKKNLKKTIELCNKGLDEINSLTPESIKQDAIW